ncbi:MAG: DUF2752 domain-containing protein [Bacteroidetes bacterium]|nr:DUF2752 domain-containing protein [Bacteroidota bacterium]
MSQRQGIFPVFLKGIAILMVILLYLIFDARGPGSFFPECPFHALTGLYCPGCGSQRALSALLHGDFMEALHDNLLAMISLPFLFLSAFYYLVNFFREEKMKLPFFYTSWFVWTVLTCVIIFTILRNIPSMPFSLLAPLS